MHNNACDYASKPVLDNFELPHLWKFVFQHKMLQKMHAKL